MTQPDHPRWTQERTVVCPDCGYRFGYRSLTNTLQVVVSPGNPNVCQMRGPIGSPECPRVGEAIAAAEASAPAGH